LKLESKVNAKTDHEKDVASHPYML